MDNWLWLAAGAAIVSGLYLPWIYVLKKRLRRQNSAAESGDLSGGRHDYISELKYNAALWNTFNDAMPIHVFIKNADDDFRYIYSNQTRNDFFGYPAGKLIGQNDILLLGEEKAPAQLAKDAAIMRQPPGIYEGFIEAQDSKGRTAYFRVVQTPFTDNDGTRLLLGAALDITEQEASRRMLIEAKQRIEERESWLDRTLKSIGDAVIVTNKHGETVIVNPVAERLLGVRAEDAIGVSHDEIFKIASAQDSEPRQSPVWRALRTGMIVELANHTDLISKTGERYHISDSAAPILDEQKNVLGAVLVFRDVTEEYQRRSELRDAVKDWEMASEIGNIAAFRINHKTLAISGSKRLSEFWPMRDGTAIPAKDWIYPDDLPRWKELLAELCSGSSMHTFFQYRILKDGKFRYYRIFGALDPEHTHEITGILQDITESREIEKKLHNAREMWTSLIDALPVNFFTKNVDDHFRYQNCNQKFAQLIGRPVEQIIGRTDAEIFGHRDDSIRYESVDREIMKSGTPRNFTESVFDASGRKVQLQTVKMPCVGPDGERLLMGVSIDITDLVNMSRNQEALRQGLEMLVWEADANVGIPKALKSICEHIGVARSYILHIDTDRKCVTCVREYCRQGEQMLLGQMKDKPYTTGIDWAEQFKDECFFNIPDLQSEETLQKLGPFYAEMIRKGEGRSLYCHRLIIDGKFWGYVGLVYKNEVRILDKGELDFVQSAARLIELMIRHKKIQESLQEAAEKAQAAEKAKSNFLASMSHEIRTPLNAVIGYAELLKDGTLPLDRQKDYLNDISVAGNALLALINDILDLSKLEAGKMFFVRKTTDFQKILQEVMTIFRQKLQEKNIAGVIETHDMPFLMIDELRLRQILFNLIGNAVKFTDHGSITVAAAFTPADKKFGTLRFVVRDTGCGISEADQKRLFQPFEQSRAIIGSNTANAGTGLGLNLVRRMLSCMNGKITLDSAIGLGSSFTVTISHIEYTRTPPQTAAGPEHDSAEVALPKYRILLVDDVPMNLKVVQAMLDKIGMETTTARNADEALAVLAKQPVDILLTDLWMPGMNGAELAEKIRQEGMHPGLYIAVLTADTEVGVNFSTSVIDEVLTKPLSLDKLRRFLENAGVKK